MSVSMISMTAETAGWAPRRRSMTSRPNSKAMTCGPQSMSCELHACHVARVIACNPPSTVL